MTYVITEACIGVKDRSCVEVCPMECFYEGSDQLYIDPDACVDCGGCIPMCPVNAIFLDADVPAEMSGFIEKNARVFTDQHQAGCGCGSCDPETNKAIGKLSVAQPR
jgi:NAD-dependent dihydropyrimidine dehydrogenase PreA subunit